MIRFIASKISYLVGAAFAGVLLLSLVVGLYGHFTEPPEEDAAHALHQHPRALSLPSDGPLGKFDRAQLQRGFQVYKEVCAGCHGLSLVAFRDLEKIGYNAEQVKALAAAAQVPSINPDTGEAALRKALPSDRFPSPYANEVAARAANNNALPPDLSLIAKAREGGAAYIYSLLTGYRDAATYKDSHGKPVPAELRPSGALHFNPWFANINLAMPAPLTSEGQVSYGEGAPRATVDQMAKDVSAFLVWTAEPNLEDRHSTGLAVVIFLLIATALGYMAYQNVWAEAKRKVAPKGVLDPANQAKVKRAEAKAGIKG